MKKMLYFLPAILVTLWTLCLNVLMRALIPLWHIWNLFFWLSGWLMSRGRAWGCAFGLVPAAMVLYLNRQGFGVPNLVGMIWTAYYLACGAWVWRKRGK